MSDELQIPRLIPVCAERIAVLFGEMVDAEPLAALLGAAAGLRQVWDLPHSVFHSRVEHLEAALRECLGPERYEAAYASGRPVSFDQTLAVARQVLDAVSGVHTAKAPADRAASYHSTDLLSPREREVLQLVADGLSNRDIAPRLVVGEHTAKYHITALSNKLGVDSRAQAVAVAAQRGLLAGTPEARNPSWPERAGREDPD